MLYCLKGQADDNGKIKKFEKYCDDFYNQGLRRKVFRGLKVVAQLAGSKNHEKWVK